MLEYPLFALVGPKEFPAYHRRHNRGLPVFVILASVAALVSAVVLIFTGPVFTGPVRLHHLTSAISAVGVPRRVGVGAGAVLRS